MSKVAKIRKATKLYEDFTGHTPKYIDEYSIKPIDIGFKIGDCDGLLYTTVRDGKTESYIHKFKKKSRPQLISSFDGKQLHILGGEYEFTERGIVDK